MGRWLWPGLALTFAVAPAFFWSGELLSEEVPGLFRKNWAERSFLEKTFDPRGWDFYQGRELSYAIDFLDAQWVRWALGRDHLWLVPPSGMLASLGFVAIGFWLVPRVLPALQRTTRWLPLLVLLSNFVVQSTMGVVYRATKPLVAPLLLGLLLFALGAHRQWRVSNRKAFAVVFSTGLVLSLLDRQGLFYLLLLALALGLAWHRTRQGLDLLAGAVAAAAAWFAYLRWLGPWLIHAFNGYWPTTRFQRLRPSRLLQVEPWRQAVDVLGDWTSVLLGGLPAAWLFAAAAVGCAIWVWRERRDARRLAFAAAITAIFIAAQLGMVAMMVERHPPVAWIGNRLWYYPLPFQAVLTFALLWALEAHARRRAGSSPLLVPIALAALVMLNVLGWPDKRGALESDPPFQEQSRHSELFGRSFRNGSVDPGLDGGYRRFFFECLDTFPRLAARARDQVGEGDGFLRAEWHDGRLTAWAAREAHLLARTRAAGRYRLVGTVRLRPSETLSVLLGARSPRLLAQVQRTRPDPGDERLEVPIDLARGATDVRLLSNLPEEQVPDQPPGIDAAYRFVLPVALLLDGRPVPPERR